MIEYTLWNVLILELKVYCGSDKFYSRSKLGQYGKEKNRAPLSPSREAIILIGRWHEGNYFTQYNSACHLLFLL